MSLLEESMRDCVFIDKTTQDSPEGGYDVIWKDGATFQAAIVCDNSMEALTAQKAGVTSKYTVTIHKSVALTYHTVFKRVEDGKIFRVTSDSDDVQTPARSSFQIAQVTAEEFTPA